MQGGLLARGSSPASPAVANWHAPAHRKQQHAYTCDMLCWPLPLTHVILRSEVNELNAKYGFKSLVEFYEAENGLPACCLLHPRGHILEVYLQVGGAVY